MSDLEPFILECSTRQGRGLIGALQIGELRCLKKKIFAKKSNWTKIHVLCMVCLRFVLHTRIVYILFLLIYSANVYSQVRHRDLADLPVHKAKGRRARKDRFGSGKGHQ